MTRCDVAIVGGGPAGLACATFAARRGLRTVVLERSGLPRDKACGEGLMPSAVRALDAMGALARLPARDAAPFKGVRYVQEDGSTAEAMFQGQGGLVVRRVALSAALLACALEAGADVRERTRLLSHRRTDSGVLLATPSGLLTASVLVAADGLYSPIRRAEGLDMPARGPRRFGLRRHYRVTPWGPFVEVYFSEGLEAYVTPAGAERVGVAFLWDAERVAEPVSFARLMERFPSLASRLDGCEPDSELRGAGPLERRARAVVLDRLALLGDAAGYVDAITGEGLSLALHSAADLAALLPEAIARGARARDLLPYQRAYLRRYRRYARLARALVEIAARPAVRRRVVAFLAAHPRLFDRALRAAVA